MCGGLSFGFMLAFCIANLLHSSSIQIIRASCTVKMGLYLRIFFLSFSFRVFLFFLWFGGRFFLWYSKYFPSLPTSLTPPHFLTSRTTINSFISFQSFAVFFLYLWVFFYFKKSSSHGVHPSNPFWIRFKVCSSSPPLAAFPFVPFRTSSHRSRNLARSLYPYIDVSITPSSHLLPRPFYF